MPGLRKHGFRVRPVSNADKAWAANNRDKRKRYQLRHFYNLELEEYEVMLQRQDYLCAICQEPMGRPCVDHDHETGRFRGILCVRCNTGLHYLENLMWRRRAQSYLD